LEGFLVHLCFHKPVLEELSTISGNCNYSMLVMLRT
jgi:hypothetical protein